MTGRENASLVALVEQYRPLLEGMPDALLLVNDEGKIVLANTQAETLFDYAHGELTGLPVDQLLPDRFRGQHEGHRKAFFSDPKLRAMGTRTELFGLRKDGDEFSIAINLAPLKTESGLLVSAAIRDVSETQRIVRELRESEEYTRGLIESNMDAPITTDPLGIITDVNKQMCEMTGYPREALIGTPLNRYFTDSKRADDSIRRVLTEDRVSNYELTLRSRVGKETMVSYNAATFRDTEGRLKGVFAAARDITDQKRLEEQITQRNRELTEATGFLNNVLESATEYSIIAKDSDGNILTWNEGARRNYGYSAEEMVGKSNSSTLHMSEDIESGRVQALFGATLKSGKAEGVFERRRKSGERFTAAVSMTLRRDAAGAPVGYLMISKDITEQKRLEEQVQRKNEELEEQYRRVQEANRLKSEFLANMSHELRTPLNAIIGFSEMMHDGKAGVMPPQQKEFTGDILTSARHLLQLINDVLDLAKVEAGKMEFHPEPVDLPKLINEVRDVVRTLIARKHIKVSTQIDPGLTGLVLDPGKLKQVLYNYLSNAIKFTHDEGEITVRAVPEDADHFRLEVRDTGIGIKPGDLGRLFVEFEQLDTSISKKYQGTGLGLALTRRIVEAQGGRVGVNSELAKGSTFYVVLPRKTGAGDQEAPARPRRAESGAPVVLVVEDDPRDRAQIELALSVGGYAVETALSGSQAIALCRERAFAGITLDLLLPDSNGWEVLNAIRAQGPNMATPVIVVSIVVDKAAAAAFTVQDYLVKPFQAADLIKVLRRNGVSAPPVRCVLIVDDDRPAVAALRQRLDREGYRTLHAASAAAALKFLDTQKPDAAVINVEMASGGFELLAQMRLADPTRRMPVIVSTWNKLQGNDLERLHRDSLPVVAKGEHAGEAVVAELRAILAKSTAALLKPAA